MLNANYHSEPDFLRHEDLPTNCNVSEWIFTYIKSPRARCCLYSCVWLCVGGDIETFAGLSPRTSIQQSMNKKEWLWGVPAPCGHRTARAKTVPSLTMGRTYLQQPPGGRTTEDSSHLPAVLGQGPKKRSDYGVAQFCSARHLSTLRFCLLTCGKLGAILWACHWTEAYKHHMEVLRLMPSWTPLASPFGSALGRWPTVHLPSRRRLSE